MDLKKTNEQARSAASEIAEVAGYMWKKGWAEAGAGNISLNVSEHYLGVNIDFRSYPLIPLPKAHKHIKGNFIFITTKGARMRSLAKDPGKHLCLIKISEDGKAFQVLFENKEKPELPSSELPTHLAIHNQLTGHGNKEKAIVHAHATELSILSHIPEMKNEEYLNNILWSMHTETIFFLPGGIGFVPYRLPGTQKMALATLKSLEEHRVLLWEKHGTLATGSDIQEAFDRIDIMASAARIYLGCKSAGFEPEGLTRSQLQELKSAALDMKRE
jgi:rhamnulose-1-phosphate aldolase